MEEYEYTEHWMQRIVDRLDRLIEIGERVEGEVRLPPEDESQTFANAKEPAKEPEPEHPPDPGEGYRILSKNPPEDLSPGDEYFGMWDGLWRESRDASEGIREQRETRWYRRKIEPAKSLAELIREPVEPILPKVGDWVRVTKPQKQDRGDDPIWLTTMDQYDGKVFQVKELIRLYQWPSVMCDGINCAFKIDWLSPAEPPEPEYREPVLPDDASEMLQDAENAIKEARAKSAQYRQPVLPADLGKWAEFSQDGINWTRCKLRGCYKESEASLTIWSEKNIGFRHCRIKKDA